MCSAKSANMAAAAAGRTSRRRTKRAAAAYSFLSNISLDGNITKDATNVSSESIVQANKYENISPLEDVPQQGSLVVRGRKLMHSISESAAVVEPGHRRAPFIRGRSVTNSCEGNASESLNMRRTMSLVEPSDGLSSARVAHKLSSKQRITCLSGASFYSKRRVNDKR